MPSHWTYEKKKKPQGDIYQGDIISRTGRLLKVLGKFHGYFCNEKYLGFIVTSQTCDLVIRGGECKAKHINLAVIRSLESMMPSFLKDVCGTVNPGVYYSDRRAETRQLLTRIINQNEQALGLFYLEPDADLKLAVESIALLRVSIALTAGDNYRILKAARVGRLRSPFRNKLGWLVGNLYSRVDTPDWPEEIGNTNADKKVNKLFKDLDEAAGNVWVSRGLFDLAVSKEPGVKGLPKDKVAMAIEKHAPPPPCTAALARVQAQLPSLLASITYDDFATAAELLKEDEAYSHLAAVAVALRIGDMLGVTSILEFVVRLGNDRRVRDHGATWLARLGEEFMKAKARKDYPGFIAMYGSRPFVEGEFAEAIGEHILAIAPARNTTDNCIIPLASLAPTPAMQNHILLLLQAASTKNIANRLAARLDNDSGFTGAFTV